MEVAPVLLKTRQHLETLRSEEKIGFLAENHAFPFVHGTRWETDRYTAERVDFMVGPTKPISPANIGGLNRFLNQLRWWEGVPYHDYYNQQKPETTHRRYGPSHYGYAMFGPEFERSGYIEGRFSTNQGLILGNHLIIEDIPAIYRASSTFEIEDEALSQQLIEAGAKLELQSVEDPHVERHIYIRPYPTAELASLIAHHEQGWIDGTIAPNFILYTLREYMPAYVLAAMKRGRFTLPELKPLTDEHLIQLGKRVRAAMVERYKESLSLYNVLDESIRSFEGRPYECSSDFFDNPRITYPHFANHG